MIGKQGTHFNLRWFIVQRSVCFRSNVIISGTSMMLLLPSFTNSPFPTGRELHAFPFCVPHINCCGTMQYAHSVTNGTSCVAEVIIARLPIARCKGSYLYCLPLQTHPFLPVRNYVSHYNGSLLCSLAQHVHCFQMEHRPATVFHHFLLPYGQWLPSGAMSTGLHSAYVDLLQVILGMPGLCFPGGLNCRAWLVVFGDCFLSMWLIQFHFLLSTWISIRLQEQLLLSSSITIHLQVLPVL